MSPTEKIARFAIDLLFTDREVQFPYREDEDSSFSTVNITMNDKTILIFSMPKNESSFDVVVKKWDQKENYKEADRENDLSLDEVHFMIKNVSNYITKISIYTGFVNERLESTQQQPAVLYWNDEEQ